jgi:transposase
MARVIGMDVHRDFAQVVVLDAERLRHLGRVQLDKNSLVSFANRLAPNDEVVLEATGNTFAIVRVLRPKVSVSPWPPTGLVVWRVGCSGLVRAG